MPNRGNVRARLGWLIGACAVCAGIAVAWSLSASGSMQWHLVAVFTLLAFAAETFAVTTVHGSTYSVTFIFTIAALTTLGPAGAILASVGGTTGWRDAADRPPIKHLFNGSQIVLATTAAASAYVAVAGADPSLWRSVLAVLAAAVVNFLVNTGLVSIAIGISTRLPAQTVWRERFLGLAPAYLAYAVLGLLVGVLSIQVGWVSLVFFLVPILVARSAFHAAIQLQDAFEHVVKTLVAAVEHKDPYTKGHAERVSGLAERVARAHGMTPQDAKAIRYAALMHDVGKLAVHNAVLQKPGSLTDNEHTHMRQHTEHGADLAQGIDLMSRVLDGIRHHHERWDGHGYPDGLAGEAIPVAARIITVSDAFDAMTSERCYSPAMPTADALEELDRCAGEQFDPSAVAALKRTVSRDGWIAAEPLACERPAMTAASPHNRVREKLERRLARR